jgi:hypothetical protein
MQSAIEIKKSIWCNARLKLFRSACNKFFNLKSHFDNTSCLYQLFRKCFKHHHKIWACSIHQNLNKELVYTYLFHLWSKPRIYKCLFKFSLWCLHFTLNININKYSSSTIFLLIRNLLHTVDINTFFKNMETTFAAIEKSQDYS